MSTYLKESYSSPKNIRLKGGLLKFDVTKTSNPFGDEAYGLYVNSSGELVFRSLTTSITLGAAGGGGSYAAPSWDQIFAGDQTIDLTTLSTFTIDRSSGNNNVLTLTNTGTGSGVLLQITNAGSGADISGTAGTWSFSKAGVNVMKSTTIAGSAGSNSIVLTAGDMLMSDGSFTVIDADNAATFSVTNNTVTSASMFVVAGAGTFTGNTTSSFMTVTSGATTGTVLYIPVTALTTGTGINLIGTTALTTGIMLNVQSGTTGTSLTGAGRLFKVTHTGTGTNSGILTEITSAAVDETVVFQVTASGVLALGTAFKLSTAAVTTGTLISALGAALTTGNVFSCTDLAALTTGYGINIAHATSVITTGGLMLLSSSGVNTGSGGDGTMIAIKSTGQLAASLVTVATIMTTGTTMSVISTGVMTTTGNLLTLTANAATTAAGLLRVNANGLTSGIAAVITSSATAITGAGRLLRVDHTGATGASATLSEFASAATDETVILKVTASAALAAGRALSVSIASMTTGYGLAIDDANALTTGRVASFTSNSADATARTLVRIHNDHASAVGAVPLEIVNDGVTGTGSKFAAMIKMGGTTIWRSIDGTSANGALTGTAGDICLNGGSNKPEYCTGTTNWTALV